MSGPALGVGRVGSRLGPQDLGGPKMPKIGPQLVAIKRSRCSNRTVTTLIEQPIIQSSRTLKSYRLFCCSVRVGILLMTLIGVEWLQEVAVTFFFFFFLVFTLICGPPKIILPRAPQSVRPGLHNVNNLLHSSDFWCRKYLQ